MSFCRIPSSSSEDGTLAPLTESDLSDSLSVDSRTQSAGEEEPPTKRKRDKALKTAAERNRKSGRMKAAVLALSPTSSALQKVQQEETASVKDVATESVNKHVDKTSARNCIPDSECDSVVKNIGETEKNERHLNRSPSTERELVPNEDCHVDGVASVSKDSHNGVKENTTTDKADKASDCEHASSAQRDNVLQVDSAEVAAEKECSEADCITIPASKCSADESCEKECTGIKQNSSSTEATDIGKSVDSYADGESSGRVVDDTVLNANSSESKSTNDEPSAYETNEKNDEGCKNYDETHCSDVAEASTQSNTTKDEDKSDKRVDRLASNGHPARNAKKMRGRPKKSNKKGRKKRVHSNVTNTVSVTEVQETDYEPTKKLGRPSKKSKLAQLAAEACDSLPQSEDDIPLIELRRSARANKGQRKLDQLVLEQPKKRNRAKDEEKERKRAEKEEKRRKREAELQEQAALKAKKVYIYVYLYKLYLLQLCTMLLICLLFLYGITITLLSLVMYFLLWYRISIVMIAYLVAEIHGCSAPKLCMDVAMK